MKRFLSVILAVLIVIGSIPAVTLPAEAVDVCDVHTYGAWNVTKEATCTEDGEKQRKCLVCGYIKSEVVEAAHSGESWETTTAATCTKEGLKTGKCKACGNTTVGKTITETIPAKGHYLPDIIYSDVAEGETTASYSGNCTRCGEFVEEDIEYKPIYTVEDLRNIDNDLESNYVLMNDIDLTEATGINGNYNYKGLGWKPIGSDWGSNVGGEFTGVFNGNGHTIKGMRINFTEEALQNAPEVIENFDGHIGLFGRVLGDIINLNVAFADIDVSYTSATIDLEAVYDYSNDIVGVSVVADCLIGTIAGYSEGVWDTCSTNGEITVNGDFSSAVGGMCGVLTAWPTIRNCSNSVDVYCETTEHAYAGGIAGMFGAFNNSVVDSCFNKGAITLISPNEENATGGIAGVFAALSTAEGADPSIENFLNAGAIKGSLNKYTAGIFGVYLGASNPSTYTFRVIDLYYALNMGDVKYTTDSGNTWNSGIAITQKYELDSLISSIVKLGVPQKSYFVHGENSSGGEEERLSESSAKQQSSYRGFDFTNKWLMDSKQSDYPVLRNSFCSKYGHTEGAETVTTEPTCGEDGSIKTYCVICSAFVKNEVVPKTNAHDYGSIVIDTNPTATTPGSAHKDCVVCGDRVKIEIPATTISGECGQNLTWTLSDGCLIISGSGAMTDWANETDVPWYNVKDDITRVILDDNITTLGTYAFYGLANVTEFDLLSTPSDFAESVQLSTKLEKIGANALTGCGVFNGINNPETVEVSFKNKNNGSHSRIFKLTENESDWLEVYNSNELCSAYYSEWVKTLDPTCTEYGSEYRECSLCGYSVTRTIAKMPHTIPEGEVTKTPTCTTVGKIKGVCTRCLQETTAEIPCTPHYGNLVYGDVAEGETTGTYSGTCDGCDKKVSGTLEYTPIYTVEDLRNIDNDLSGAYVLMNDIDLTEATGINGNYNYKGLGWKPIGSDWGSNVGGEFTGVFNGNGHTIKGMRINFTEEALQNAPEVIENFDGHIGLFGRVLGNIINLNVAFADIDVSYTSATIDLEAVYDYSNDIVGVSVVADCLIGTIAGYSEGVWDTCSTNGEITVNGDFSSAVGGMCGVLTAWPTIRNCSNSVDVYCETTEHAYAGGIAGMFGAFNNSVVDSCFNKGAITLISPNEENATGGIAGVFAALSTAEGADPSIENFLNAGAIKGSFNKYTAGIFGVYLGASNPSTYTFRVIDLYYALNMGDVKYTTDSGNTWNSGIAITQKYELDSSISSIVKLGVPQKSYFVHGEYSSGGEEEQLSESSAKQQSSYSGFDFTNKWVMDSKQSDYPVLRNSFCLKYGHTEGTETVTVEPTCGEDGAIRTYCANCSVFSEYEVLPKTNAHDYGSIVIDTNPTATTPGIGHRDCVVCGHTVEVEIPVATISGECGQNLTWSFSEGCLIISGNGEMTDWAKETEVPWYGNKNDIVRVVIDENVTTLGSYAFYGLTNVTEFELLSTPSDFAEAVQLSTKLQKIGANALTGCGVFSSINNPETVEVSFNNKNNGSHSRLFKLTENESDWLEVYNSNELCSAYYSEWVKTLDPTCTKYGSEYRECSLCGYSVTRTIAKLPHTIPEGEVTKTPTCTTVGRIEGVCTRCLQETTAEIPCTPHYGNLVYGDVAEGETTGTYSGTCDGCDKKVSGTLEYTPIYTVEDLRNIDNDLSGAYVLMNDIDLSVVTAPNGTYNYKGIGWKPFDVFSGVLNGNGHTIKGLYGEFTAEKITAAPELLDEYRGYIGLFSYITSKGRVLNLNLEAVDITVSYNADTVSIGNLTIGEYAGIYSDCAVGTLAGECDGSLENCSVSGKINVSGDFAPSIGGFAGFSYGTDYIKNCSSNVDITCNINNYAYVGGIIGLGITLEGGYVDSCFNSGDITVISPDPETAVGGLFGYFGAFAPTGTQPHYANLYNTGNIKGASPEHTSGIRGRHRGTFKYAGLSINSTRIELEDVYSTGLVQYSLDSGVNWNLGAAIDNEDVGTAYYLKGTGNGKGSVLTEETAKQKSSYSGFDFSKVWVMDSTKSDYPLIRNYFCTKYNHSVGETEKTQNTCLNQGVTKTYCAVCDICLESEAFEGEVIHNYSSFVFDIAPTISDSGVMHRVCYDCGKREEKTIAPFSATGQCGNSLEWMYSDGFLYVGGSGEMYDWQTPEEVPWHSLRSKVERVILLDSVTSIGSYAFCDFTNLKEFNLLYISTDFTLPVQLSPALEKIGANALTNCATFPGISNPETIKVGYANTGVSEMHSRAFKLTNNPKDWLIVYDTEGSCSSYYGNWVISKVATCVNTGLRYKECSLCGYKSTQTIAKTTHSITTWETTTAATCTSAGSQTGTCSICSATSTRTIPKLSHSVSSWSITTSATCTQTGVREGTCDTCGTTVTETIAKKEHSYGAGVVTIVAEGETTGKRIYDCEKCSATKTETIRYTPIYTIEDLRNIDNNLYGNYLLMNDLDLTDATSLGGIYDNMGFGWVALGITFNLYENSLNYYNGVFNGNGHTIKGLSIHADKSQLVASGVINIGLFGGISKDGIVSNLELSDVNVDVTNTETDKEGLWFGAIAANNEGSITNCNVSGKVNLDTAIKEVNVGGIVGETYKGSYLLNNTNNIDIAVKTTSGNVNLGGIAGYALTTSGKFVSCSNNGDITSSGSSSKIYTGGIVGHVKDSSAVNTYAIYDCYNTGNVCGVDKDYTAGIAGRQATNFISKAGVINSYNIGLVEYTENGNTRNKAYAIASGKVKNGCYLEGTGIGEDRELPKEAMKDYNVYDFAFGDVWIMADSYDYPVLKNSFCNTFGHKAGIWELRETPTCGYDGIEILSCKSCGIGSELRTVPATEEHKLGALTITKAPTKDATGEGYRICDICGKQVSEIIEKVDDSGSCGDNLSWTISDGVLSIHGSGAMANWSSAEMVPWYAEKEDIIEIKLSSEITSIGNYAFYGCEKVTDIVLPSDLVSIGVDALANCGAFAGIDNHAKVNAIYRTNNNGTHNKIFKLTAEESGWVTVFDNCDYKETVVAPTIDTYGYTEFKCTGCGYRYETNRVDPIISDNCVVASKGESSLVLFNSGLTSSAGKCYGSQSSCKNPAWNTIDNNGYDIYGRMRVSGCSDKIRIGLSFYVPNDVVENAIVAINAYDVDEGNGEYDKVILVDEITGEEVVVGTLSGMNNQWNNTKITIPADKFTKGHIYHLEVKITDTRGSATWWVYVRNVSLQITVSGKNEADLFTNAYLNATIDESGVVNTTLTLSTTERKDLQVEYDAVCADSQYGSSFNDITSTDSIKNFKASFALESGAPKGIYAITAYIKDTNGNVLKTITANTGYTYNAVSYDSNGGTNTVPVDTTPYSIGKQVNVLFNTVPTRDGYAFLGWSTTKDATEAEFTPGGTRTFVMKDEDVVLYAVWSEKLCDAHKFITVILRPGNCLADGEMEKTCEICGFKENELIIAEHNFVEIARENATCTTDGYVEYECIQDGCDKKRIDVLTASHQYTPVITKAPTKEEAGIITYTCAICGDSYTQEIIGDGSHILLVQDTLPWSEDNNPTVLNKLVEDGFIDGWTLTTTDNFLNVDLSEYEVILIANDQTTSTYNKLASFNDKICDYAENGGIVIYGACDNGWKDGEISYALPGGVTKSEFYSTFNYIVDYSSSVVKGDLTDNKVLTDEKLMGNFCSHTYFNKESLPADSNIILVDANGNPTLVEYSYGSGTIVASGLTWEYHFTRIFNDIEENFSKSVYDDLLIFALSDNWCIGCKHATQIEEKAATCTEDGYVRAVCSDCREIISEKVLYATGHEGTKYKVIKKASCTEDGLKELYCGKCNVLIADNIVISASDHEFTDWTDKVSATCQNSGIRVRTCIHTVATDEYEACSYSETKDVEQLTHVYSDIIVTSPATCIEDGIGYTRCTMCGDVQNEIIPATGHNYSGGWVILKEATCETDGLKTHVCLNCNQNLDETVIEALGHSFDSWTYDPAPTCTMDGTRSSNCTNCGKQVTETARATGHRYSNVWTIDVQAGCETTGEKSQHCLSCDERTKITVLKAKGHSMSDWVIVTVASCTTDGERYRTCSGCELEERETLTATGHNYNFTWTYDVEPTCTEAGEKSHHCLNCDDKKDTTVAEATGHDYGDWIVVIEATPDADGERKKECDCGAIITEKVEYIDPSQAITGSVSYIIEDKFGDATSTSSAVLYADTMIVADISNITTGDGGVLECTYQWYANDLPIENATKESYVTTEDDVGKKIYVTITAKEPYSGSITGSKKIVYLDRVKNLKIENTGSAMSGAAVKLTWDKHDNATEYIIYKSTSKIGVPKNYVATTTETEFFDKDISLTTNLGMPYMYGKNTYYLVVAVNGEAESYKTKKDVVEIIPCATYPLTGKYLTRDCIELDWRIDCSKYPELQGFVQVMPFLDTGKAHVVAKTATGDWEDLGEQKAPFEFHIGNSGFEYFAIYSEKDGYKSELSNIVHLYTMRAPTVVAQSQGCYLELSWDEIPKATSYDIYKNGVLLETVTATSYEDHNLDDIGHYEYRVIATDGNIASQPGVATLGMEKVHDYDTEVVVTAPTCTESGSAYAICKICEYKNIYSKPATGHTFSDVWEIVKAATCDESGSKVHKCLSCGTSSTPTTIAATGHTYGALEYAAVPSCTEAGLLQQKCTVCDKVKESDIPAMGHNYSADWVITKEPSCTESGKMAHKCSRCNDEKDIIEIEALGHDYTDVFISDTQNSCDEPGEKSRHCIRCDARTDITTVEPMGHIYDTKWTIDIDPTCEAPGEKSHYCINCSDRTDVTTMKATGHSYTDWVITTEATCFEEGYKYKECENCKGKEYEVIPAGNHAYSGWTVATEATCDENGLKTRTCKLCEGEDSQVITKLGHFFATTWTVDTDATCTTDGTMSHHCTRCDAKQDKTVIESTGHAFGSWLVETPATCTAKGVLYRECEVCSEKETKESDMVSHNYSGTWVITTPATCTEDGIKSRPCLNCDSKQDEITIVATGHSVTDWEIVTEATCTEDGSKKGTCSNCDYTEDATIPAYDHVFSSIWTVDKDATCTEAGSKSKHCTRCDEKSEVTEIATTGHVFGPMYVEKEATCNEEGLLKRVCEVCETEETEVIEKLEHIYATTWTIETPATCTEDGIKYRKCVNCEEKSEVSKIDATGHLYGAWVFDSDATCESVGSRYKTCETCGNEEKQEVLALGHHHSSMWTIDRDPTCLTKGEKSHHCLRCEDKKDVEEIACSGHIFEAWEITKEPTMDSEGMRSHKCYNCDETETLAIAKLKRYTATFVADGDVVATIDFPEDATEIKIPDVPFKDKYVGEWENFDVRNKNFTVNAIYTPVYSESLDGITATNKTEYYQSTGEVEINLHAEAIEKTIVTTTKTAIPLDIVFVLDQSGSMEDGNKTEELKSAVTAFSNTILEDAKTNNVEHRIAIVGFASGSNNNFNYENTELLTTDTVKYDVVTDEHYKNSLVQVNDNGDLNNVITKAIKNIDAEGATKADLGLEMASNIFANNPVTDNRQRVVVFLTDGVPTSYRNFEFSVANAAILNAYQIKNTYDATIYSVGIFDRETSGNKDVNNFMNYVSSNYNEEKVLSRNKRETTPAAAGYYLDVSDVSKLSEIFTTIVEEAIIHTGEFDDVTLKYTLSKDFCLTSVQKEKLRKDAIELLEVSNNQISITENADGTTTVIITDIEPWSSGGKYVVDFTFRATANENTMKSGSYRAGTYDSGIMLNNSAEYEAVFAPELFDVIGTNSMAIFSINGEPYAIDRVSSTKMILAPDVDFGEDHEFSGWNVPENLTLKNECRIFDASLDKNEYVISWNINGQVTEQKYEVGSSITPPTVKGDEIEGMIFVGWDKEIPEAMPSENLTFTAVYNSHYHNYTITKEFETCDKGGTLTYTCVCGDSYDEQIEPTEHKYEAITGATENNTQHNVGFRCSVCGSQDDKKLELERTGTTQTSNSSHSTATYEFDYVDENGENCQPDGEVQISVQLDEVFNGDIPENATATVYRVNDDGSRTKLESTQDGMNMTFETDHFSTYEFEFTTEVQKYMFAQVGSVIDTKNKIIFSENYVATDCSKLVSYLAPATITSESNKYGFFGTGSSITFENNGVVEEYKVIIKGDLNGDSVCDVLDCMLAELIRTGNCEATQEQIYAANNDVADEVDVYDFQNVINWALAS